MIDNLFNKTCIILRVQASGDYGGISSDQHDEVYKDVPCMLIQTTGKSERVGEAAVNTVVDGYVRIAMEIFSRDRLVIDDYEYDILNVKEVLDLFTERVEYWQGSVTRIGKYNTEASELVIVE